MTNTGKWYKQIDDMNEINNDDDDQDGYQKVKIYGDKDKE